MKILYIFIILMSEYSYSQKIEMTDVLKSVFCTYSNIHNDEYISFYKVDDNIFSYNSELDSMCFKTFIIENDKVFLRFLKENKKLYYVSFYKIDKSDSLKNEIFYSVRLSEVYSKHNKRKINTMVFLDEYELCFFKNIETEKWEIKKILYPKRIQGIINLKK